MHILHSFSTFVKVLKGEFVQKSRTSLVVDRFLYSHDLNVLFRGDLVGRNQLPVILNEGSLGRVAPGPKPLSVFHSSL